MYIDLERYGGLVGLVGEIDKNFIKMSLGWDMARTGGGLLLGPSGHIPFIQV